MPYATYRFNKIIAADTIRFIVTVAIVVYKGLKLVVYRMLTNIVTIRERKFRQLKGEEKKNTTSFIYVNGILFAMNAFYRHYSFRP